MPALNAQDWINTGLQVLNTQGYSEMSIVKLSAKLGVTRGSFYHHFKSFDVYIDELIANWEERIVNQGFDQTLTTPADPQQEFKNLITYVTSLSDKLDLVFRQWAPSNAHVKGHMERLDKKRLSRLEDVFVRLSKDETEGKMLAQISFYAYIGSLHTYPYPSAKKQAEAATNLLTVIQGYLKK